MTSYLVNDIVASHLLGQSTLKPKVLHLMSMISGRTFSEHFSVSREAGTNCHNVARPPQRVVTFCLTITASAGKRLKIQGTQLAPRRKWNDALAMTASMPRKSNVLKVLDQFGTEALATAQITVSGVVGEGRPAQTMNRIAFMHDTDEEASCPVLLMRPDAVDESRSVRAQENMLLPQGDR